MPDDCPWHGKSLNNFLLSSRKPTFSNKIPEKYFPFVSQNFWRPLLVIIRKFVTKTLPMDTLRVWMMPCDDLFIVLLVIKGLPTFLYENLAVGCPQAGCPGPSHRPHPPLHATGSRLYERQDERLGKSDTSQRVKANNTNLRKTLTIIMCLAKLL